MPYREIGTPSRLVHATTYSLATFCGLIIPLPRDQGYTQSFCDLVTCPRCKEIELNLGMDRDLWSDWFR